ncbi:alginate lyase family protein [Sphingomonas sp. QA11]|uniref:alginate lyase family protein n=1 Tax=Sphingomonas sp. QA11 TaxID=2950605 RepID=UPI002349E383|nr:alginate lyase family protein [Sphingomonas sp. QA11]WCM26354.1 alginate lyase family protein [Sphingomonas sp. QA11]
MKDRADRSIAAVLLVCFGLTAAGPALATADSSLRPPATPSRCAAEEGYAPAFDGRRTFYLKPDQLNRIKAVRDSDPAVARAYAVLIERAEAALRHKPGSVMDKTTLPLSGDRHDYLSIAPYWWPDPASASGPYVRRDGEVNPQRDTASYDRTAIGRMSADAETLSLAYFYGGERKYADKTAQIVRTWFLDPATAMNPNATFAQAVPGRENGRAEGVLDTNAFQSVIDAVGLIGPSGALGDAEVKALEIWFGRYVDWMLGSPTGREEQAAKNNHGIWFDAQLTQYALFARRPAVARKAIVEFPGRRIATQFDPSGSLPAELTRTRSFHYSIYALEPAYDVAEMAGCLGLDLWNYADDKGRGLRKATDFLAAYRGRQADWPHQELKWPAAELDDLLTRADWAWGPGRYPRSDTGRLALRYAATSRLTP